MELKEFLEILKVAILCVIFLAVVLFVARKIGWSPGASILDQLKMALGRLFGM